MVEFDAEAMSRVRDPNGGAQTPVSEWGLASEETGKVIAVSGVITVGRRTTSEVVIPDGSISREHAKLFIEAGELVLEDLSRNGTSVNGTRVKRIALKDGDKIGFSRFLFRVVHHPAAKQETSLQQEFQDAPAKSSVAVNTPKEEAPEPKVKPNPSLTPAPSPVPAKTPAPVLAKREPAASRPVPERIVVRKAKWWQKPDDGPQMTVFMGDRSELKLQINDPQKSDLQPPSEITVPLLVGLTDVVKDRQITLQSEAVIIGRSPECDEVIVDDRVSDKHAQIISEKGTVSVVSLPNCTNGTFVNGARAAGRVYLNNGDILRLGDVSFVFWAPSSNQGNSKKEAPKRLFGLRSER